MANVELRREIVRNVYRGPDSGQKPIEMIYVIPDPRHKINGGECKLCHLAGVDLAKPCVKAI